MTFQWATHSKQLFGRRLHAAVRLACVRFGLIGLLASLVVMCTVSNFGLQAQEQEGFVNRGDQIKAAYLYNFGKYVTWPTFVSQDDQIKEPPFVIGIVGDGSVSFDANLQTIAKKKMLQNRRIQIWKITSASQLRACQILYFPEKQDRKLTSQIMRNVKGMPVLLVGESPDFIQQGGMIRFYLEENKLKFEIHPAFAVRAQLKISSKLLRVGKVVK